MDGCDEDLERTGTPGADLLAGSGGRDGDGIATHHCTAGGVDPAYLPFLPTGAIRRYVDPFSWMSDDEPSVLL